MRLLIPLAMLLASCASHQVDEETARVTPLMREDFAHDMAQQVITAERAFDAAAARDGQWTAFRAYAASYAPTILPWPPR